MELLHGCLQALQNLEFDQYHHNRNSIHTYLELYLGLGNILFTATTVCNLRSLVDLRFYCLVTEVFQRVALDGIDAELGVGLNNCKASRY